MKQIIDGLNEIQKQLEGIEVLLTSVQNSFEDLESINQAEAILKQYHQHISKLENMILSRRVELLEKKVSIITAPPSN